MIRVLVLGNEANENRNSMLLLSSKKWSVLIEILGKYVGALNENDLKATLFSTTGGQILDEIEYSPEGINQLCDLMGVDVAPRKEFVMSRIDFSEYGDT